MGKLLFSFIAIFAAAMLLPVSAVAQKQAQRSTAQVQKRGGGQEQIGINVLSIIPAQGVPGMTVTLNGTGFTGGTSVFLGSLAVPTKVVGAKILSFEIPDIPPGLYALFLKRDDGATSRPYNFPVQAPKPVALSLAPDTVYSCSTTPEREVVLSGRNFQEGAQLLIDGAAVKSRFTSTESIAFAVPNLLGSGLHQVQVKNPSEELSGAIALFINSKPEILGVSRGEDFVNYYELIIDGKNFQQGSTLIVDGARLNSGATTAGERERLVFNSCNRLVYQRHPYDSSLKTFLIQVVNSNGEESQVVSVNAP